MDLATLFPNASPAFLRLNGASPQRLPDPQPKRAARKEPLALDERKATRPQRVEVRIIRRGTKLLDKDNLFGSVKYLCDALRYEGLIPDDNPEAIELIVTQEKVKRAEVETVIRLTPLPDTPPPST